MIAKKIVSILLTAVLASTGAAGACFSARAAQTQQIDMPDDDDFNADAESDRQKLIALEKDLPEKFDLRNFNGKNYVTPVKLQNPYGSCWAFAMAAAAEISYLYENDMGVPAGEENNGVDFSEKYISWYMRHALTKDDVLTGAVPASQVGEGYQAAVPEQNNRNAVYNVAGNPLYGVNFYASGLGPVDESTVINGARPYRYSGKNGWRTHMTDEESAELATLRREFYYNDYKKAQNLLIEYGYIKSADEFDDWFEKNWKDGFNIYGKSLSGGGYSEFDDWTLPLNAEYRFPEVQAFFKSSYLLPTPSTKDDEGDYRFDRSGVAAIKSELNKGRGVSIGMLADQSSPNSKPGESGYMNTATWSQYYSGVSRMNHLVTVVGYDDNYPKENFTHQLKNGSVNGTTPPGNGAFIVKNSWGRLTDEDVKTAKKDAYGNDIYESPNAGAWGINNSGYFYLSYYDHSIHTPLSFSFYDEKESEYHELNYDQYDLMMDVDYDSLEYERDARSANIFTAEEDGYLCQISSMVTAPLAEIRYEIYKDVGETPDSGELIESGTVQKEFAGYQRIDLKTQTFLPKGTRYSVIITQTVLNKDNEPVTPVPVSICDNYKADDGYIIHSVVNKGESFLNDGKGWTDLATLKQDLEKKFFNQNTKNYSQSVIDRTYPNGVKDYQVDNFPIKAFSVPARNVTMRLMGDVSFDGKLTIDDATLIQKAVVGSTKLGRGPEIVGDVDGDGIISVSDATCVQKYLADYQTGCGCTGGSKPVENDDY